MRAKVINRDFSQSGGCRARKGFTLIELLAVVLLMSILMGTMMYAWKTPAASLTAEAGARSVADSIELARIEAVKRSAPVAVVFDLGTATGQNEGANQYCVFEMELDTSGAMTGKVARALCNWKSLPKGQRFITTGNVTGNYSQEDPTAIKEMLEQTGLTMAAADLTTSASKDLRSPLAKSNTVPPNLHAIFFNRYGSMVDTGLSVLTGTYEIAVGAGIVRGGAIAPSDRKDNGRFFYERVLLYPLTGRATLAVSTQ